MISPLFVGGLGNRLFQLANSIFIADYLGVKMVYRDLTDDLKRSLLPRFEPLKLKDFQENGGHPTKNKIEDIFEIEVGPVMSDGVHVIPEISERPPCSSILMPHNSLIQKICPLTDADNCVHLIGYYFDAEIVEYVIRTNKFPKWSLPLKNFNITPFVVHLRVGYEYDNFPLNLAFGERMKEILDTHPKEWTIFTNDTKLIPSHISSNAKYVYGPEVDVYDMVRAIHTTKIFVMSNSTLSAWIAFLGTHDKIYCPLEYHWNHGKKAVSSKWMSY